VENLEDAGHQGLVVPASAGSGTRSVRRSRLRRKSHRTGTAMLHRPNRGSDVTAVAFSAGAVFR
jgi:hypothetical protein